MSLNYTPYYQLTDHLGSVRVVFESRKNVLARNDYYAFGKKHLNADLQTATGDINRWHFNGKEWQTTADVGFLDYGARMRDPEIVIWGSEDPLAEERKWVTPYNFVQNNPIGRTDKDGRLDDWYINERTSELYYNQEATKETIVHNTQFYTRIGDNNMMGDMGDVFSQQFSLEESKSIANENGYRIEPTRQFVFEETVTSKAQTGPKNSITITMGSTTIINECYAIIPEDQHMSLGHSVTSYFKSGQTIAEFFTGGYHSQHAYTNFYTPSAQKPGSDIFGKVYQVGTAIMAGQHDYTNTITYSTWSRYSNVTRGNGELLKYRQLPSN